MVKTLVVSVAAAIAAASACVASAAMLGVGSAAIGAGDNAIPHCDDNGFTHSFTTSRGNVTAVTVGDISDPACEGGDMQLTLTNAAGDSIATAGPQTAPTDGDGLPNSVSLVTSAQPGASQVSGIHISVEGP